jgi:hypothetical protein
MDDNHLKPFNPTPGPRGGEGKLTWPTLSVRVHPDELAALDKLVRERGTNRSNYVRGVVVRSLLAEIGSAA